MSRYLLSLCLLVLSTVSASAVTYPTMSPAGEASGGTFNQYFTNMFSATGITDASTAPTTGCSIGQVVRGFTSTGILLCTTGGGGELYWKGSKSYSFGTPTEFLTYGGRNLDAITSDSAGNLYIAGGDWGQGSLIKITPSGTATTVAGGLQAPVDILVAPNGDAYVADRPGGGAIEKITPDGTLSRYASNVGGGDKIVMDTQGNIYAANTWGTDIIKIPANCDDTCTFSTVVSTGIGQVYDVAIGPDAMLYVTDYANNTIQKIPLNCNNTCTPTIAYTLAFRPVGIDFNTAGDLFVTSDSPASGGNVYRITPTITEVVTAGYGSWPQGVGFDTTGNLYVGYWGDSHIIKVPIVGGLDKNISFTGGNVGIGTSTPTTKLDIDSGVVGNSGLRLRQLSNTSGENQTNYTTSMFVNPAGTASSVARDSNGNLYAIINYGTVVKITPSGIVSTFIPSADYAQSIAIDDAGNIYVTNNTWGWGTQYTVYDPTGNIIKTVSDGNFLSIANVQPDHLGNTYVASYSNSSISKVDAQGNVTVVAWLGSSPGGLAVDADNNIYAGSNDGNIYKISPTGAISTWVTGLGTLWAIGMMVDPTNTYLFLLQNNRTLTKISLADGTISALGVGINSNTDLTRIDMDEYGNIYYPDMNGNIGKITFPTPSVQFLTTDSHGNVSLKTQKTIHSMSMRDTTLTSVVNGVSASVKIPSSKPAKDCSDYLLEGKTSSGIYTITSDDPSVAPFQTYCDMSTDGGGWTMISHGGGGTLETLPSVTGFTDSTIRGYLSKSVVQAISKRATDVMLASNKGSTYFRTVSTGNFAITALQNGTDWWAGQHTAWIDELTPTDWSGPCGSPEPGWPDMFWAGCNQGGVHWLMTVGAGYKHTLNQSYGMMDDSYTWIRRSTRIIAGTYGAGKVLTSDANGVASWKAPRSTAGILFSGGAGVLTKTLDNGLGVYIADWGGHTGPIYGTYNNLPSYLIGLPGTDIVNGSNVTLTTSAATDCYMIHPPCWGGVDMTGWGQVDTVSAGIDDWCGPATIFKKSFAAGTYSLPVQSAMYACEGEIDRGLSKWVGGYQTAGKVITSNGNSGSLWIVPRNDGSVVFTGGSVNTISIQNGSPLYLNDGRGGWTSYENLPSYLIGLPGTDKVNGSPTTLTLDTKTQCYLMYSQHPWWNPQPDLTGWTQFAVEPDMYYHGYLTNVYTRTFEAGTYSLGTAGALYACAGQISAGGAKWSLSGNAGTTSTDFLGTNDAQSLILKQNATKVAEFNSWGTMIGVGNYNGPNNYGGITKNTNIMGSGNLAYGVWYGTTDAPSILGVNNQVGTDRYDLVKPMAIGNDNLLYLSGWGPGNNYDNFVVGNANHLQGLGGSINNSFIVGNSGTIINVQNASIFGHGITNNLAGSTMIGPSDAAKMTIKANGDINFTGDLYKNGVLFGGSQWTTNGANIYNANTGNVGIGVTTPTKKLEVNGDVKFGTTVSATLNIGPHTIAAVNTSGAWNHSGLSFYTNIASGMGNNSNTYIPNNATYPSWEMDLGGANQHFPAQNNPDVFIIRRLPAGGGTWASWNELFRITNTGNIGIGTGAPTAKLSVNGAANNTTGTWGVFSDIRSKEHITDYTRGLSDLMRLHPVTFSYKPEFGMGTGTHIGFIAQELQAVSPESVTNLGTIHGLDNFLENNQEGLMQMTIRAIQELKHQNDMLSSENESLKKRLDAIEARLAQ